MSVDVLLGLQWGDEGKGKVVDFLAPNMILLLDFKVDQMQVIHLNLMIKNMFYIKYLLVFSERINIT